MTGTAKIQPLCDRDQSPMSETILEDRSIERPFPCISLSNVRLHTCLYHITRLLQRGGQRDIAGQVWQANLPRLRSEHVLGRI